MRMPHIESLVDDLFIMVVDIVVKRTDLAKLYETAESERDADYYLLAIENRDDFFTYYKYERHILVEAGIPSDMIENCYMSKVNIPEEYRNAVFLIKRNIILNNYVEQNNYYRMLMGLPDIDDYNPIYVGKVVAGVNTSKPIHEMSNTELALLKLDGVLVEIIESNQDKKYLKRLGHNKIDFVKARRANRFDILNLGASNNEFNINLFRKSYYYSRNYILGRMDNSDLFGNQKEYHSYISLLIVTKAMQMCLDNSNDILSRSGYFDELTVKYILQSHMLDVFDNIPLRYRKLIADNIKTLIRYRGTDKMYEVVYNIFGFDKVDVFKHYVVKSSNRDVDGKVITEGSLTDRFNLRLLKIAVEDDNISTNILNPSAYVDYDEITEDDPLWGVYSSKETVKNRLLESNFNINDSKYIALNASKEVTKNIMMISVLMSSISNLSPKTQNILVSTNTISGEVTIFDLLLLIFDTLSIKFGFDGAIIYNPDDIAFINGFNFDGNMTTIQNMFTAYNKTSSLKNININMVKFDFANYDDINISLLDDIISMNTNTYNVLRGIMDTTESINEYRLCSSIIEYLYVSKINSEIYRKSNGELATTYRDLLMDRIPYDLATLDNLIVVNGIDNVIDSLLSSLSKSFGLVDIKYSGVIASIDTSNMVKIRSYISDIMNIFKSMTITMLKSTTTLTIDDTNNKIMSFDEGIKKFTKFGYINNNMDELLIKNGLLDNKSYIEMDEVLEKIIIKKG